MAIQKDGVPAKAEHQEVQGAKQDSYTERHLPGVIQAFFYQKAKKVPYQEDF